MGHTAHCMPIYGNVPTIVLPDPGAEQQFAFTAAQNTNVPLKAHRGEAVIIQVSSTARITFNFGTGAAAKTILIAVSTIGPYRFLMPDTLDSFDILPTATGVGVAWREKNIPDTRGCSNT